MLRMSVTARGKSRAGIGSAVALALALASGAAAGTAVLATPAFAQRIPPPAERGQAPAPQPQPQQQRPQDGASLSRSFQPVYQAVANATNTTGDLAAAKAQVPAMVAAIGSEYDRFFAGNILLQLGAKSSDRALQKQGLELMLASGRASPADTGLFHYYIGGIAYDSGDYESARRALQASIAAGFQGNFAERQDPWGMMADAYVRQGQVQEALQFYKTTVAQRRAAGQAIPEPWLVQALGIAYEQRQASEALEWAALLVEVSPTETNWQRALQVVNAVALSDDQVRLDLYRLMALTNALKERGDFNRYIDAADARIMANEVARVLDAGLRAGAFTASDDYYTMVKTVVDERAPVDRREAPSLAAEARSAAGTGRDAQNAGDVFLSLGSHAEAEEMYALGLQKGGGDRDRLLTRLGIAQVHQGKLADAKAAFAQVSGERAGVARMWTAYIDSRA